METKKKKEKPAINKEALQAQLSLNALHGLDPNNEIVNYLTELSERTDHMVNLVVIGKALNKIQENFYKKTGTYNMVMFDERYKEYKSRMDILKKEKAVENALKLLLSLKPVLPECQEGQTVNKDIECLKLTLQNTIRKYLDLSLYEQCFDVLHRELLPRSYHLHEDNKDLALRVIKECFNPDMIRMRIRNSQTTKKGESKKIYGKHGIQRMHGIWKEATEDIFNEFKRLFFSDRKAYIETDKLFKVIFSGIYAGNPDLIRLRIHSS